MRYNPKAKRIDYIFPYRRPKEGLPLKNEPDDWARLDSAAQEHAQHIGNPESIGSFSSELALVNIFAKNAPNGPGAL